MREYDPLKSCNTQKPLILLPPQYTMRKMGMVVILMVSLAPFIDCSQKTADIEWTFEPHADRSLSVKAVCTMTEGTTTYRIIGLSSELWIKNLKTYELESRKAIESTVQYDSETDTQSIIMEFDEPTPEDLKVVMEFDAADHLSEEAEKTFIFEWNFGSDREKFHTALVILPKDTELLEVEYTNPKKVEEKEQVMIYYEGISGPGYTFQFQVTFSASGKNYIQLAEIYEEAQQYDQAISQYRMAKSFYNRFDLYKKDKSAILGELQEKIFAIQKIQADSVFQEGMDAFNEKDYETAETTFEKALTMYETLKDTEGELACESMLSECLRIEDLQKEADTYFEQGKTQFTSEEYESALESFTKARQNYEELEDTAKVTECDEWIAKCNEAGIGVILCVSGVLGGMLLKRRWSS